MKYITLFLFMLSACKEGVVEAPRVYSDIQLKAIQTLPVIEQAYMDDCFLKTGVYSSFQYCLDKMRNSLCPQPQSGSSVGSTAVGTAVGIGAAKLLFGK